jgi:hypothetical protein
LCSVSFQSKQGMLDYHRFSFLTGAIAFPFCSRVNSSEFAASANVSGRPQSGNARVSIMAGITYSLIPSTAIALALHGEHTPEFRGHHTNTDAPPNEQAGTAISEQPLVACVIGSLLDK